MVSSPCFQSEVRHATSQCHHGKVCESSDRCTPSEDDGHRERGGISLHRHASSECDYRQVRHGSDRRAASEHDGHREEVASLGEGPPSARPRPLEEAIVAPPRPYDLALKSRAAEAPPPEGRGEQCWWIFRRSPCFPSDIRAYIHSRPFPLYSGGKKEADAHRQDLLVR
jgi:hypothetical protein